MENSIQQCNVKDFIFQKYICKMYVYLGRYLLKLQKIKIYIGTKTTFEKTLNQKFVFFNVKDFIFHKYISKMYILADI